jgi:ribosomal protein L13E
MNCKIKQISPQIFAVVVKSKYERAMLFCRAQEYYECPSRKFRSKRYSIWDYMRWYNLQHGRGFSYGADWSGFNIPLKQINDCYTKLDKCETPYDHAMLAILEAINKASAKNGYVIACGDTEGATFKHELCHALYHTDAKYKRCMDALTLRLNEKHRAILERNVLKMGYAAKVINDEIQAYLQYGYEEPKFGRGVSLKQREKYSLSYQDARRRLDKK